MFKVATNKIFVPSTALSRGDNHLGAPTVFTDSGVCYLLSDRCRYQVVTTSFLQSSFIRCDNVTQLNAWRLPCLYTRPSNFLPQGGCLSGHLEWQGRVPKKKPFHLLRETTPQGVFLILMSVSSKSFIELKNHVHRVSLSSLTHISCHLYDVWRKNM